MENKQLRLGLQINSLDRGYKTDVYEAIEKECIKKNADLLLFLGNSDFVYSQITEKNIDSLITLSHNYLDYSKKQIEHKIPTLTIQKEEKDTPFISVNFNNKYRKLIDHVIERHGCKTFNIIISDKESQECRDMLAVCIASLADHNIQIAQNRVYKGNSLEISGYRAMAYFEQKELLPVDCIICLNDDMAIGVTNFAKSRKLNIPRDFKLIAFDDILESRYNDISITTINRDIEHLSKTAVDLALDAAKGLALPLATTIDCKIKYRKSCGCIVCDDYETDFIDEDGNKVPFSNYEVHKLDTEFFSLEHDLLLMRSFFYNVNNTLTLKSALLNLSNAFNLLKLKYCAIVLFERKIYIQEEEKFEMPSRAKLMLNYAEEIPRGDQLTSVLFDPRIGLLPEGFLNNERHTLIFNPLVHNDCILGYMVYEPGQLHKVMYDTAFSMVAALLNAAIFFTERLATEQHQSLMLQKLEHSNSKLNMEALTDELTKLYNRRGFINFAQQTIELALEMEQHGLVFYADMDGLKGINDTYGHEVGDIAIKAMASILRQTFRNQDIVGRMGGDEFAIVTVGIDREFLPKIRERITIAEEKWFAKANQPFHLGISFGAVEFNPENQESDVEKLLAAADEFLYKEKVKKHSRSATKEKPMEQR